jgi:chromosome segregation protein
MKQAVKWLATLGVKPQDFTAAQWTRRNQSELEKVVELDADELQERVGELEGSVDDVQEDVDSLESQVTQLEGELEGVSEGVQQNRDWISDVESRVDDAVKRVDASRKEFHDFQSEAREEIQGNKEEIDSVENWFADEIRDTEELMHKQIGKLQDNLSDLDEGVEELQDQSNRQLEAVKELTSVIVEGQLQSERQRRELQEEVRRLRRLQERSVWDKARSSLKTVGKAVKSVLGGVV